MKEQARRAVRVEQLDTVSAGEPEILTVIEAARLLRVSKAVVYALARHSADFPVRKVGNKLRFSREALLAWVSCRPQQQG